jgi:hypothetical protein
MDNAQHALPEAFISLGEDRFKVVPSFAVFCRFEEKTGKNGLDPVLWIQPSATDLVTLVWAAIGGKSSGKTVEQVAELMTGQHLEDVKVLVSSMFKKAELPEKLKNEDAAE